MITGTNESKTLTKHISGECKCEIDGRKCNLNQKWNNDKCWCKCKKHYTCEKKIIFEILLHKVLKMVNIDNWQNFIDNLVSTCDEIIEETKKVTRNFDEKNAIC